MFAHDGSLQFYATKEKGLEDTAFILENWQGWEMVVEDEKRQPKESAVDKNAPLPPLSSYSYRNSQQLRSEQEEKEWLVIQEDEWSRATRSHRKAYHTGSSLSTKTSTALGVTKDVFENLKLKTQGQSLANVTADTVCRFSTVAWRHFQRLSE